MFNSIKLYAGYLAGTVRNRNLGPVLNDLKRYDGGNLLCYVPEHSPEMKERSLELAVNWLLKAQAGMDDNGFGSYHLSRGWSTSYPETTGYIIPTLLRYGKRTGDGKFADAAINAANWLISIQKPSGGWQGKRMEDNEPEVVFNTGQVIRGLNAAYRHTLKSPFIDASVRACDWLCDIQHTRGFWKENALMNQHRVYDSFVDAPLLETFLITGNQRYRDAALKNLHWIINEKQRPNGWFEDCDNTVKHNHRPILHTIAYTIDGLIDCSTCLEAPEMFLSAKKAAEVLMTGFLMNGRMHGRYDSDWKGSEYFICTGGAQMAMVWFKIHSETMEECYLEAASRMVDLLVYIQQKDSRKNRNIEGALPGSFPVWGKYEPFAFPNWGTKFFADALMMSDPIKQNR